MEKYTTGEEQGSVAPPPSVTYGDYAIFFAMQLQSRMEWEKCTEGEIPCEAFDTGAVVGLYMYIHIWIDRLIDRKKEREREREREKYKGSEIYIHIERERE